MHRERRLVGAENLGNFRTEEVFQIRTEGALNATELFRWLTEITVTEGHQQFMGPLITLIHERFHCGFPSSLRSNRQ